MRRTDSSVLDLGALALMRFMLPPYSADTDPHEVRLMGLRPLSYDDLNSPDATCRFPARWATPALMGYELSPEVDLAGRPVVASVRLTGVVYTRSSRKLYHCIDNAWVSSTQLCAETYGLLQYTDTMSSDGLYLNTAFCHATPFMISETLGTPATCVAGLYGCKCTLTSPYDTRAEFLGYLLGGAASVALSALVGLASALHVRAMRDRRRIVARDDGEMELPGTELASVAPPALISRRAAAGFAAGSSGIGRINPGRARAVGPAAFGARWLLWAIGGGAALAGGALLTWAVTAVRIGDPDGTPVMTQAAIWVCFLLGVGMALVADAIRMVDENRVIAGAIGAADVRTTLSRIAVGMHIIGAALVAIGVGLLLRPTPPEGDTRLLSSVDAWLWVPILQLMLHLVTRYAVYPSSRRLVVVIFSLLRLGSLAPLIVYLVRVPCGTVYRD